VFLFIGVHKPSGLIQLLNAVTVENRAAESVEIGKELPGK